MASSGSVFSETLQTITTTKLQELATQRLTFEKEYEALLQSASEENDPIQRLSILVDGAKSCLGVQTASTKGKKGTRGRVVVGSAANPRLETDLKNIDRFLEQARYDPSVSPRVLEDWEKSIRQYLHIQSSKYQYADLYGKLVTEWLSSEKSAPTDGDVEMGESFEELPGAKKMEARAEWEKVVFEPSAIDVQGLQHYLHKLFISRKKHIASTIQDLRDEVEAFERTLGGRHQFNVGNLRWIITGVQSSDLLSNEKREVLKDFLSNDVILAEIGDVLDMRMAGLERWSWGDHVPLEQRRKLNGGYSIHMHEDLLQAIFLHYIGVKWSVFFKSAFESLRREAWQSNHATIPTSDSLRREYFLGQKRLYTGDDVEHRRAREHEKQYFAHQLLDHDAQQIEIQEGEEEAEFGGYSQKRSRDDDRSSGPVQMPSVHRAQQPVQMPSVHRAQQPVQMPSVHMAQQHVQMPSVHRAQQTMTTHRKRVRGPTMQTARVAAPQAYHQDSVNEDDDDEDDDDDYDGSHRAKNPMQAKQHLLHIVSTEILLNKRLNGEATCFRSVFESWNPLLPHDTILTVLKFLGVSDKWRTFFQTFLQAPLKFMDDPSAEPRLRRRGTPGSHTLSDVFGEMVFACLDFSVNQATGGGMLHRLYDDIWFWSKDYEKCARAWASVTEFSQVMGVNIDESKTGSVRIARDPWTQLGIDDRLPSGEIRWGFLYLDSTSGRFEIDEKMVAAHIEELHKQLEGKSKSVIGWIQAWNTYAATFFSSNFGKAANCFGRDHVDKMLVTHRRIQETIFDGGNVVRFIKETIKERFHVDDIPDGFLFFPVELGGLDLKSPFVELLQIRKSVKETPQDFLDDYEEQEREDYNACKQRFDRGEVNSLRKMQSSEHQPVDPNVFFTFEEYVKFREEYPRQGTANLLKVYEDLLKRPVEESIDVSVQIRHAVEQLRGQSNLRGILGEWGVMEAYWKWVTQMYGPDMVERFGGLGVVDPGLLPVGMVSLLRQKRIMWQG